MLCSSTGRKAQMHAVQCSASIVYAQSLSSWVAALLT